MLYQLPESILEVLPPVRSHPSSSLSNVLSHAPRVLFRHARYTLWHRRPTR